MEHHELLRKHGNAGGTVSIPPVDGYDVWVDGSDVATMFSDFSGSTPVSADDYIQNITNKGLAGGAASGTNAVWQYVESGLNGLPSIKGNGAQLSGLNLPYVLPQREKTIFIVTELYNTTDVFSNYFLNSGNNVFRCRMVPSSGYIQMYQGNMSLTNTSTANRTARVFCGRVETSVARLYRDGVNIVTDTSIATMAANASPLYLGSASSGSNKSPLSYIGDYLIYPTTLAVEDVTLINNWLMEKWGLV